MDNRKQVQKYMTLYTSFGMNFGASVGLVCGMLFPDNRALGMCFGIAIGTCIGIAVGAAKDKRLSEKMMEIAKIEAAQESSDMFIYVVDEKGAEKEYRISEKKMKKEKFLVGNRVAEETDGSLVSLESN